MRAEFDLKIAHPHRFAVSPVRLAREANVLNGIRGHKIFPVRTTTDRGGTTCTFWMEGNSRIDETDLIQQIGKRLPGWTLAGWECWYIGWRLVVEEEGITMDNIKMMLNDAKLHFIETDGKFEVVTSGGKTMVRGLDFMGLVRWTLEHCHSL